MVNICGNFKKLKGYLNSLCETIQQYCKMHISVQISNSLNFPVSLHIWQCWTVADFVAAVSYIVKAVCEDELLQHLRTGKDSAALCGLTSSWGGLGQQKGGCEPLWHLWITLCPHLHLAMYLLFSCLHAKVTGLSPYTVLSQHVAVLFGDFFNQDI